MIDDGPSPPPPTPAWLALARPAHWIKNAAVLAPLLFAGRLTDGPSLLAALATLVAFCLATSGVYAGNDLADRERDARHPVKRHRPLAAGRLEPWQAAAFGASLAVAALVGAAEIGRLPVAGTALGGAPVVWIGAYLGLNLLYSLGLKRLPVVDVLCLALGFALRLVAGSAALDLEPSRWLLLCGTLLALTLALGKRRSELDLLTDGAAARPVLATYDRARLDAGLLAVSWACLISYAIYTLAPDTRDKVGSLALVVTVPPVVVGLFRFTRSVRRRPSGDVVQLVLSDRLLLACVLAWVALALGVIHGLPPGVLGGGGS